MVYAFKSVSPQHREYRSWLDTVVNGDEPLALTSEAIVGFVRVVTNPKIFADPAPTVEAVAFASVLAAARGAAWLPPTQSTWEVFRRVASEDRQVRANLVPDAWLAALALSHGCRLATADRGFGRFDGLDWFNPV